MRLSFAPLFAALAFLSTQAVFAAPPNDNRANAIALPTSNQAAARGHNIGATTEPFERIYYPAHQNAWFKWTAPCTAEATLDVIGNYDPTVVVFEQQDDGSLTFLGYDDDNGDGLNSRLPFSATAGKTYFVAVDGFGSIRVAGSFLLTIVQQAVISDSFDGKKQFVGAQFTAAGNNSSFTLETNEPLHGSGTVLQEGKSGWITWTPVSRSLVTLDTKGSQFDTLLAVYTGDTLSSLTQIAKNDDVGGTDRTSQLTFTAQPGTAYHFAAAGKNSLSGLLKINLKATRLPPGIKLATRRLVVYAGESGVVSATTAVTGDPTYRWEILGADKKWTPLSDGAEYAGTTTTSLTIINTDLSMNGNLYRLVASDEVSTTRSQSVLLTVTEFPALSTEVLGTVEMNLAIGNVPEPTSGGVYFAVGLPKGLTIDPATGIITGVVTAKPGTYLVTYGSTSGKVRNSEQYVLKIVVAPFSPYFTGSFEALLNSPQAGSVPSGKLSLKVTATGSFTGSYFVLTEGKAYSFRGSVTLDQTTRTAGVSEETPILISRGKSKTPLSLSFVLREPAVNGETEGYTVLTARAWDSDDMLIGEALDGAAVSRFTTSAPAPWAAQYTVRLADIAPVGASPNDLPLGAGYATASITPKTGALALRGRLADNTQFTANLASSQEGAYRLGQRVYAPGGSLAGRITLAAQFVADVTTYHVDASTGSTLYWVKPLRPKDKLYPDGFGPVTLTYLMEPWQNPAGNYPAAFGLSNDGDMKVNIVADNDHDGNDALTSTLNHYGLPIDVRISANGGLSFVSPVNASTKFKVSFNAVTGAFTGSYELAETEIVPPAKKPLVRKVVFNGVLFQPADTALNDILGEGFAIVPPHNTTEKATSALIQFLAGPPDSPFGIKPPTP